MSETQRHIALIEEILRQPGVQEQFDTMKNKSSKIRLLHQLGAEIASMATYFGMKYQGVYNIATRAKKKPESFGDFAAKFFEVGTTE